MEKNMSHYFCCPDSFRLVQCKKVSGERARKKCREWNKLIKQRNKYKKQGDLENVKLIEEKLFNF